MLLKSHGGARGKAAYQDIPGVRPLIQRRRREAQQPQVLHGGRIRADGLQPGQRLLQRQQRLIRRPLRDVQSAAGGDGGAQGLRCV